VLGELLAGMLLGMLTSPLKLQSIATDPHLDMLARIGMLLLLFEAGLDLSIRDLFVVVHSEVFVQRGERPLGELLQPMTSFLVPVFFVLVGFRADFRTLAHPTGLAVPLALTLAAILGKLTCGLGVLARSARVPCFLEGGRKCVDVTGAHGGSLTCGRTGHRERY
jgi:Kef-type K+ transport system membrane component KefB